MFLISWGRCCVWSLLCQIGGLKWLVHHRFGYGEKPCRPLPSASQEDGARIVQNELFRGGREVGEGEMRALQYSQWSRAVGDGTRRIPRALQAPGWMCRRHSDAHLQAAIRANITPGQHRRFSFLESRALHKRRSRAAPQLLRFPFAGLCCYDGVTDYDETCPRKPCETSVVCHRYVMRYRAHGVSDQWHEKRAASDSQWY